VVVFGDSVAYGSACPCTPFVNLYARAIAGHNHWQVTATNLGRRGATVSDVRALLDTAQGQSAVKQATTVLIMVGANDFQADFDDDRNNACAASDCYSNTAQHVKLDMADIVRTMRNIHGTPLSIVILNYWDVVKDGTTGTSEYGPAGAAKSQNATSYANAALHAAAQALGTGYVSTQVAFRGPNNDQDPTPLLASDGDHPNATGHQVITRALTNNRPHG
jgi:acyl-CoA thioesterase-1